MGGTILSISKAKYITLEQIRNPEAMENQMYASLTARTHAILNYAVENYMMELTEAEEKAEKIKNLTPQDSRGVGAQLPSINASLLKIIDMDHKTALKEIPGYAYPTPNLLALKRFAHIFRTDM